MPWLEKRKNLCESNLNISLYLVRALVGARTHQSSKSWLDPRKKTNMFYIIASWLTKYAAVNYVFSINVRYVGRMPKSRLMHKLLIPVIVAIIMVTMANCETFTSNCSFDFQYLYFIFILVQLSLVKFVPYVEHRKFNFRYVYVNEK